jgi:TATA-binding protein-associated factor Taf7
MPPMLIQVQQHLLILRLPEDMVSGFDALIEEGVQPPTGDGKQEDMGIVEIQPDNTPTGASTAASSSSSSSAAASSASASGACDRFTVTLKGTQYPAVLMNLPSPVEAHKIMEGSTVTKSGDIGQVLQLFHTKEELEAAEAALVKSTMKGTDMNPRLDMVLGDGLAPVTANIVKSRYELTRKYVAPALNQISGLVDEIAKAIKQKAVAVDDNQDRRVTTTVDERVVQFEPWMCDDENPYGITVVFDRKAEVGDTVANLSEAELERLLALRAEGEEEDEGEGAMTFSGSK